MELIDLKGIGPKRAALFSELGIRTPEDLITFYPREYLDYSAFVPIRQAEDGDRVSICVTAQADPTVYYFKGKYIVSLRVADSSGSAVLKWINQPYRSNQFHAGDVLYANATVSRKRGIVFYNPQINRSDRRIVPIYESSKGLTQTVIRDSVKEILEHRSVSDSLPADWIKRYQLTQYSEALQEIHFPTSTEALNRAKKRIAFEEAFLYFTAIRAAKADRTKRNGFAFRTDHAIADFLSVIQFTPTDAQMRAIQEIESDMRSDRPMNRLIQGDVGSGKTLVAEFALFTAERNGKQGVMLAPTELLAEQHYRTMRKHFPDACLYIGQMPAKERKTALDRIASGDVKIVIGTHALLSDSVLFHDLGLVVTDEQHRFGVMQRAKIESKGIRPDVLVMSATPIPRTLALLMYADLDLSVINMMPPGRKTIITHFVPQSKRNDLYRHLEENAQKGERAYVVCPLIEPTEGCEGLSLREIYAELKDLLKSTRIGVLHGQMPDAEKQSVMEAFRNGSTDVLISTTIVEVGVDVPEATSMVIEGADHFGLATLHQLRGRVGRGDLQSHCYLLAKKMNDHAKQRIEAMLESSDGFFLAQKDYEMRGSGDLFGVRQSGDGEMNGILSSCTAEILETASACARDVFSLPSVQYNALLERAKDRYRSLDQIAHN